MTPKRFIPLMKIIISTLLICLISMSGFATTFTDSYNLGIPANGDRDWAETISRDIISVDVVMGIISSDIGIIRPESNVLSCDAISIDNVVWVGFTSETLASGGEVGRIAILSADGSTAYLKVYSGS